MKNFILLFLFFLFYFITVKDLYDDNKYLTEDIKILENEISEKDKTIYEMGIKINVLKNEIENLKIKKEVKKVLKVKPKIKETPKVEEVIVKNDSIVS